MTTPGPAEERPASDTDDQRAHSEEPAEGGLVQDGPTEDGPEAEVPREHSEDPAEG